MPLDDRLGIKRASHSPGVRRLVAHFGAHLPCAHAERALAAAAGIQTSASTVRSVTEAVGTRREAEPRAAAARAWAAGLPPAADPPPDRLYVALDGILVPTVGGQHREAKVGIVRPETREATGTLVVAAKSAVASFAPAAAFGQHLALEAHRRGGASG